MTANLQGRPVPSDRRLNLASRLTLAQAAEFMNVSRATVVMAGKILREGSPEMVKAVESGMLRVSAAVSQLKQTRMKALSDAKPKPQPQFYYRLDESDRLARAKRWIEQARGQAPEGISRG